MQDTKNFAFLMHPTHTTNATEGSRLALGHEGGCIKKAPAETGASRRNGEENLGCHGSGRLGGLGFAEPARLQNAHLPDAGLRDVLAPLGHGAGRNTQQLGESCGAPSELDCLLRLHGPYLSTLKQ